MDEYSNSENDINLYKQFNQAPYRLGLRFSEKPEASLINYQKLRSPKTLILALHFFISMKTEQINQLTAKVVAVAPIRPKRKIPQSLTSSFSCWGLFGDGHGLFLSRSPSFPPIAYLPGINIPSDPAISSMR